MNDDPIGRPAAAEPTRAGADEPSPRPDPARVQPTDAALDTGPPYLDVEDGDPIGPAAPADLRPNKPIDRQIKTILEWVAVAVGALAVALIIKTFLLQAFYIPSGSMEPALNRGDRVLVNKLSYDLHDVNRGDIVVFEKPPGEGGNIEDLIKRVIALPGETVSFQNGEIFVDGLLLDEPYIRADLPSLGKTPIPNCDNPPSIDTCTIPEGRVFVMGDNREESRDSRFFGPIIEDSIVGRAFLKVWPLSDLGFM